MVDASDLGCLTSSLNDATWRLCVLGQSSSGTGKTPAPA